MSKTSYRLLGYALTIFTVIIILILLGVVIWKIPQLQVAPLQQQINIIKSSNAQIIDPKDIATLEKLRIDAENAARTVIVQGTGGFFVFLTALIAFFNYRETRRNVTVAEEKQITDRFSKAVEQLGSLEIHVRIGAIYALERIAKDSEKDYWQIMEILTAYVREKSSSYNSNNSPFFIPIDVKAVLTVLTRRTKAFRQGEQYSLDLSGSSLRNANFQGVNFRGVNLLEAYLMNVNFEKANLQEANLKGAVLCIANLQDANLSNANLKKANLRAANLEGANLQGADLQEIELEEAYPEEGLEVNLSKANLKRANLVEANLKGANLSGANLQGANLQRANLRRAYLRGGIDSRLLENDLWDGDDILEDADLSNANLQDADFRNSYLIPEQVKSAKNWDKAKYDFKFLKQLGIATNSEDDS